MFKSNGRLEIRNGVRIITSLDFCLYYQRLFGYYTYKTIKSQIPMHGGHISIYLPDIHGKNIDTSIIKHLSGKIIEFEYTPENIVITRKNVWTPVICPEALIIKNQLNVIDKNFLGFHLTLCNFKGLN